MKNFLKKNKFKVIFFSIIGAIIILILFMLYPLYGGNNGSNYGNRLDDVKNIKITENDIKNIKKEIENNIKTDSVNINVKGKILNIVINLEDQVIDDATEYMPSIIELLSKKQLKAYDIQIYMVKGDINIIGYKSKTSQVIIWTNNK